MLEILTLADKQLKVKADKDWNALNLNATKTIDEAQQNFKNSSDEVAYYQTNIDWLQSRFPEAKYADVVGLCKVADKTEYAEEQDYSMNSGRYVGVENEGDNLTKEEFKNKFESLLIQFNEKSKRAVDLSTEISNIGNEILF